MNIKDEFFKDKKACVDPLTKIYTRDIIFNYIEHLVEKKVEFTYAILDIDNFKYINDTYGHLVGDTVLEEASKQLKDIVGNKGIIGRYGGDEIIIVYEGIQTYKDAWEAAHDVLKSPKPISASGVDDLTLTYTLGLARYPFDSTELTTIFDLADKALYRGKAKGRNCFIIYLEEKHKDLILQSERAKIFSPMYITTKIYRDLTKNNNLDKNINEVLDFLGNYLMLDRLSIQSFDGKITNKFIHKLAKNKEILPISSNIIEYSLSSSRFCYYNVITKEDLDKNKIPLHLEYYKQEVYAYTIVEISYQNQVFGYLRSEMVSLNTGRIWQQRDLVILINLANTIALLYKNKK